MTIDADRGLLEALLPVVLAAGRIEMNYFDAGVEVQTKADATPVTVADHEAEVVLVDGLNKVAPGVPVIAEESVAAGKVPETGSEFFLVDPLDGTRAFIANKPDFTINIGLVRDNQPIFGIIYAPALGKFFATLSPEDAVEADIAPDSQGERLSDYTFRPLHARDPDPNALVAFTSRSHAAHDTDEFLNRLPITETKKASSSLKFCLIARGEADLYARLGQTSEWDTAAGQAILTAAGGSVTTLDGAPLAYGKRGDGYINPHFVAWARGPLLGTA
ncbi:MAG: 3'(2'),5'-bisphosphate nucleotidase CysQ [Hyphomicrobium sp.]|nr:3'(2'),5'-bisphosphate nucleotidase CysQ [Hyphomicrobiaceae bacterium]